ncbi:MAG: DUF6297 family protein [Actinomycetia bacterium]|nr:DUF6297 family protein [Actinomycetes bacterium]
MSTVSLNAVSLNSKALRAMRRTRQRHRLGNIEWFDAAYRAYLVGIFGGGSVLWISSSVRDATVSAASAADFAEFAPPILGLLAAFALLVGLRGGAQGGPVALEAADVMHVMLAPVDRRRALLRPALQRVRGAIFTGAIAGAISGQLAGRRLPGSLLAWAGGGALFGASVAMLWVGSALLAHTVLARSSRVPRWSATAIGLTLVAWQSVAVYFAMDSGSTKVAGPADAFGSLALWGWRQHSTDLIATAVGLLAVILGLLLLSRISLEALARRSALVAQLRFAVTMQDLRTVILLRRQLNQERTRRTPWRRLQRITNQKPRTRTRALTRSVFRRGWHGLLRFPATRLARMAALSVAFGVLQATVVRGTTPAVLLSALVAFVIGLEVMEPLSQEVDQPDRTDSFPVDRGELLARHLLAPTIALLPFAIIAGAAAVITLGSIDAIAPAAIFALPNLIAGAAGGVVSIVRDAPDPFSADKQQSFVPPEMAGFGATIRLLWPIVVSAFGCSMVFILRVAVDNDGPLIGAAIRGAVGSLLLAVVVGYWVKVRDRIRRKFRAFMAEGRTQALGAR